MLERFIRDNFIKGDMLVPDDLVFRTGLDLDLVNQELKFLTNRGDLVQVDMDIWMVPNPSKFFKGKQVISS